MRHGAASRLARAIHDWRRAREPRYNIAASRLARATHDWRRACEPRYNIAASRLARATHDWRRAREPRYNIAASRLARATHDWRRARAPRYNIAASRLAPAPRRAPATRAALSQGGRFSRGAGPQISQACAARGDAGGAVEWIVGVAARGPGAGTPAARWGLGRHSIELARRGFQVTGVDFSE